MKRETVKKIADMLMPTARKMKEMKPFTRGVVGKYPNGDVAVTLSAKELNETRKILIELVDAYDKRDYAAMEAAIHKHMLKLYNYEKPEST